MGQATVDLPDPLNPPAAAAGNADDLLSELAGQEIDRMLADSESDRGGVDPIPSQTNLKPLPVAEPSASSPAAVLAKPASTAPANEPKLDKFLGDLAADEKDGEVSVADFAAGKLPGKLDAVPPDELANDGVEFGNPPAVPFHLRILKWMNSPLDNCSDNARELVGKIAILTMINAISVLAYVLFFRRHGR